MVSDAFEKNASLHLIFFGIILQSGKKLSFQPNLMNGDDENHRENLFFVQV